jgi:hypothetical protein
VLGKLEVKEEMEMLISKFSNSDVEENINDFESRYSFKFSEQYRNFLKKYNGGDTPDTKFKINKVSSDLKGFKRRLC